jgi:hypothetical protein
MTIELDDSFTLIQLAQMHQKCDGVERNIPEAIHFYQMVI